MDLYRAAVQHPLAELRFFETAYEYHHGPGSAENLMLLREDFCGTAAVAAAFVLSDPERQAIGVDLDGPTLAYAHERTSLQLRQRVGDLHLVQADATDFHDPQVDALCSLNFSTLIYHDEAALKRYFLHAHRCLNPGGILVMDLFGGPDAKTLQTQTQKITPDDCSLPPFIYHWEQRAFDPDTFRIDCRIHFEVGPQQHRNAFRYDWRLWDPQDWLNHLSDCGFQQATVWSDTDGEPGRFRPNACVAGRDAFTCYITAARH